MSEEKLNQQITLLFIDAFKKMNASDHKNEANDISIMQFRILAIIKKHDGIPMARLAEILHIKTPSATEHVRMLVDMEYCERIHCEYDRRIIFVKLSKKGESLFRRMHKKKMRVMDTFLSALTREDKEVLISILKKVNTQII